MEQDSKIENELKKLKYSEYDVHLQAMDRIRLPIFSGSTLRGAFGFALRKVSCSPMCKDPQNCIIGNRCPYYFAFISQRNDVESGLRNYPHPFVLQPFDGGIIEPGEMLSFGFILFGKAREILPYFIYAFMQMGEWGIGKGRGKFKLVDVKDRRTQKVLFSENNKALQGYGTVLSPEPISIGNSATIEFITPLRLKNGGKYVSKPSFQEIIRAILRRTSLLVRGYCGAELEMPYKSIIESAKSVKLVSAGTNRVEIERYSSRQNAKIPLIGFLGLLRFEGDMNQFSAILDAGSHIHIGGATAFGFGKYIICP